MSQTDTQHRKVLLDKLSIQRDGIAAPARWSSWQVIVVVAAALLIVAVLYFWLNPLANEEVTQRPSVLPSPLVTAEPDNERANLVTPAQVATATQFNAPISSVLDASGYVVARLAATVSSKTTGKIVEVMIEEGMVVEKGQIMALLDDRSVLAQLQLAIAQVDATKAAAEELESQVKRAQLEYDRARSLVEKKMVSQSDLDNHRAALDTLLAQSNSANYAITVSQRKVDVHRVALDDLVIRAPFNGVIISKSAQPGEMISPVSAGGGFTRTGIGTIVDMDSLEVEVDVNESYIDRVRADQKVGIILNAYPDQDYEGRVLAVIPTADRSRATIRVRVGFVATDQRVLPEMGVRVAFL